MEKYAVLDPNFKNFILILIDELAIFNNELTENSCVETIIEHFDIVVRLLNRQIFENY